MNVNGGAIALCQPIGASGTARGVRELLHEMIKRDAKKGFATLCIGGAMGIAMCVARDRAFLASAKPQRAADRRPVWRPAGHLKVRRRPGAISVIVGE